MRMADAAQIKPDQRWAVLAAQPDQRLPDKVTGRRWRNSCKPFMIKDTTLPRSLEVS